MRYTVVKNIQGQYSLWPADKTIPRGWEDTKQVGTQEECLSYVKAHWCDMRPVPSQVPSTKLSATQANTSTLTVTSVKGTDTAVAVPSGALPKVSTPVIAPAVTTNPGAQTLTTLDSLLAIDTQGKESPLFFIHAASGLALPYLNLGNLPNRP